MSRELIRQSLVAAIEAAAATYSEDLLGENRVESENRTRINLAEASKPFVTFDIVFIDGSQADMSNNPIYRQEGQLHLAVAAKEGSGTAVTNRMLDHFTRELHIRDIGPVRMRAAKGTSPVIKSGWVFTPILIPFWADTLKYAV